MFPTLGLALPDREQLAMAGERAAVRGEAGLRRDIQYGEDLADLQIAERARQTPIPQLPGLPQGGAIAQGVSPQPAPAAPAPKKAPAPAATPTTETVKPADQLAGLGIPTSYVPGAPAKVDTGATAYQRATAASRAAAQTQQLRELANAQLPGTGLLSGVYAYFADTPEQATARTEADQIKRWYNSDAAVGYFQQNPDQIAVARKDPVEFARKAMQVTAASKPAAPAAPAQGNAARYDAMFSAAEQQYGLPAGVLKRLAQSESSLDPTKVNANDPYGGSFGLMQINAQHFGKGIDRAGAMDPGKSIDFAARLLASNLQNSGGDLTKALYMYKGASSPQARANYASMVQGIAGNAQPTAPAAGLPTQQVAAPAAPTAPQGGPQTTLGSIGLPERDLQIAQIQLRQLEAMINSTRDVGQRNQLLTKHMEVQQGMFEAQVGQAAQRAARGDEMALSSLAKTVGVPLLRVGDGTYVEAVQGPDGQYVPAQNAQPYTAQQLAALLYQQASSAARAQAQAFNAERQKVMFEGQKAGAIAAAKQPYELQMEQAKLELNIQQKIAEARLRGDEYAGAVPIKDSVGNTTGAIIVYKSGRNEKVMAGGGSGQVVAGMSVVQ